MVNIRRSTWADLIPPKAAAPSVSRSAADAGQGDRWAWGTVSEVLEGGLVSVALDGTEDDTPPVVALSVAGMTAEGARVRVLRDSTGRVVQIEAPLVLPEGATPVPMGHGAALIAEHEAKVEDMRSRWLPSMDARLDAQQGATAEAIDAAKQELSAATQTLEGELRAAERDIAAARSAADGAAIAARSAGDAASQAKSTAESAQSAATSATGTASKAKSAADAAKRDAASAVSKAGSASDVAAQAKSGAEAAQSTAAAASTVASQAKSEAQSAQSDAASASQVASAAQSKAVAAEREAKNGKVATSRLIPDNVLIGGNLIAHGAVTAEKVTASQSLWAKIAAFGKVTTQMLVAGGAKIGGSLLADNIVLRTNIIAGNPDGTHTKLDPQGLHVFRKNRIGETVEAIRLGTSGAEDYLGIADSAGQLVSSLDASGGASFKDLSVSGEATFEKMSLEGVDVGAALASLPRPVSFVTSQLSEPANNGFIHSAGSSLMVDEHSISNPYDYPLFAMYVSSSLSARVETNAHGREIWAHLDQQVIYTDRPLGVQNQPDFSSPILARQSMTNQGSGFTSGAMVVPFMVPPRTTRGLLTIVKCAQTRFSVQKNTFSAAVIAFGASELHESLPGRMVAWASDSGYKGYTPQAAKQRFQKIYSPTWAATYSLNRGGERHPDYDGDGVVVHGMVPGVGRFDAGLIGFPDMTADLAGATVEKVEAYVLFSHWWYSEGVAGIGVHNTLSPPARLYSGQRDVTLKLRRLEGRWVELPSYLNSQFKSGAARGILLKPEGYGLGEYGLCRWRDARLRITFTK